MGIENNNMGENNTNNNTNNKNNTNNNTNNKSPIGQLISSIASNPILALFALVFLVQAYIMVMHLDTMNRTLEQIHKDNIILGNYIKAEMESTKEYIEVEKDIKNRLNSLQNKVDILLLLSDDNQQNQKGSGVN